MSGKNVHLTVEIFLPACVTCGAPCIIDRALHIPIAKSLDNYKIKRSKTATDDGPLCYECAASSTYRVKCALCGEDRALTEIRETFGWGPAEYACERCYETVPAKKWDEETDRLEDAHRYDYE